MEVPSDYVLDMMRQAINGRIDTLEKKIDFNHEDVKRDVAELKTSFKESQTKCDKDMGAMDKRIRKIEQEYQFEKGKIAIIVLLVGGFVTLGINFLMWVYSKLGK